MPEVQTPQDETLRGTAGAEGAVHDAQASAASAPPSPNKRGEKKLHSLPPPSTFDQLLNLAGGTVAAVSGSRWTNCSAANHAAPGGKFRGIFHMADAGSPIEALAAPGSSKAPGAHSADYRQHLDLLLATEDNARSVAAKLYERFDGEVDKLPSLLRLLEDKWGFPNQVFPQLFVHLRRAAQQPDDPASVNIEQWADAFLWWLQSLKALSSRTKVTRQCLVQARSGSYMQDTYLNGAKLGEGTFGEVFVMLHKALGQARVCKVVSKSQLGMATDAIDREVSLLKSLDHPHIVRIFETFETDDNLNIIMDYAEGGDLAEVCKQVQEKGLPEEWVKVATEQITSALEYMHSRAVIHCDLKPANVMLLRPYESEVCDPPHTLLVDFGLAEIFEERNMGERCKVKGTPLYLAPEGFDGHLTQKSDMWAVGAMVFEMLMGRRLFKEHKSMFVLWSKIAKTDPNLDDLPLLASDLVKALITKDPKLRPTARDCRLNAWFTAEAETSCPSKLPGKPIELGHLNYFHRSAMFCIASGMSMKDMRQFYEVFTELDTDKSGYLSLDDLTQGLKVLGIDSDPKTLMSVMDMDQSGYISYTEFLAGALRADEHLNDRLVQYAFDMFDIDGDGFISMHELKLMLSGDGPLVEVLPDGHTVAQIMNEIGEGEGRITFAQFRAYMGNVAICEQIILPRRNSEGSPSSEQVARLVTNLDTREISDEELAADSKPVDQFPGFHAWLDDLREETHQGATFGWLLTFADEQLEASYVAQELADTCRQVGLLCLILVAYSLWALSTSEFRWDPVIGKWDKDVLVAHNLGWFCLAFSAMGVGYRCCARARHTGWSREGGADYAHDTQALRFEVFLCVWGCFVPWVSCYFAHRYRVAALFGQDARDIFSSLNSDYDLILAMLGTLTFFSTRTNVRFAAVLAITINCCLAYGTSTILLRESDALKTAQCAEDGLWLWPAALLLCLSALALSGHRAVEYHRRMNFLSMYHSYQAIKELQEGDPVVLQVVTPNTVESKPREESKLRRFRTALDVLNRFCETKELSSPPVRAALRHLECVVREVHDDVVEADRWMATDVRGALHTHGVTGEAREALLSLFDVDGASIQTHGAMVTPGQVPLYRSSNSRSDGGDSKTTSKPVSFVTEPWGWDTLSDPGHSLLDACDAIFLPMISSALGPDAASRGRTLFELLARSFRRSQQMAEARAVLALRAAHWLAQELQLWDALDPVEKIALLVSAAGLHCEGGAAVFSTECLLTRSAAAAYTLEALDKSGLVVDHNALRLRELVCRAIICARPGRMLEDAQALRMQINKHGQLTAAAANRSLMVSVVAATASYSFLALPTMLHEPWALVCQEEAATDPRLVQLLKAKKGSAETLDVACWLRALIEVLMIPMCETLGVFDKIGSQISELQRCLTENSKVWVVTKLAVNQQWEESALHEFAVDSRVGSKAPSVVGDVPGLGKVAENVSLPGQVDGEEVRSGTLG